MEKSYFKSPIGILEIVCENKKLISLKLVDKTEDTSYDTDFMKNIKFQLGEYFSGKRKKFNIKINPKESDFQKKVWMELQKIPYGETKSYSQIAQNIGNKNAQRAVGAACNKNSILIIIPCHRVISKNGNLTGFACGIDVKEKLLKIEK